MALTAGKITELKSEHGEDLVHFETPMGDLVFKKPPRMVWSDFVASVSKPNANREQAMRRFSLACVVLPSAEECSAVFDAYPALPAKATDKLSDMAGAGDSFEAKKL